MPLTTWQTLNEAAEAVARGQLRTARRLLDEALEQSPPPLERAELLTMRGTIGIDQHDTNRAREDFRQAIRTLEAAGLDGHLRLALPLQMLADLVTQDDLTQARALFQRALALYEAHQTEIQHEVEAQQQHMSVLGRLGMVSEIVGDESEARRFYEQARAVADRAQIDPHDPTRAPIEEGLARLQAISKGRDCSAQVLKRTNRLATHLSPQEQQALHQTPGPRSAAVLWKLITPAQVAEGIAQYTVGHERGVMYGNGLQCTYLPPDAALSLPLLSPDQRTTMRQMLDRYDPTRESVILMEGTEEVQLFIADQDSQMRHDIPRPASDPPPRTPRGKPKRGKGRRAESPMADAHLGAALRSVLAEQEVRLYGPGDHPHESYGWGYDDEPPGLGTSGFATLAEMLEACLWDCFQDEPAPTAPPPRSSDLAALGFEVVLESEW